MTTTFDLSTTAAAIIENVYLAIEAERIAFSRVEVVKLLYTYLKSKTPDINQVNGFTNKKTAHKHFQTLFYGNKKRQRRNARKPPNDQVPPSALWRLMVTCHMNRLYKNPAWSEGVDSSVIKRVSYASES
jgi:hypothetical protein